MMNHATIVDTQLDNIYDYGICGYKSMKRPGYPEKVGWLADRFQEGLKIKTLVSDADGTQGMIEYIPGEFCWRPVKAKEYMFIHCIFVGFKKAYKGKGYATLLLDECIKDAKQNGMKGVAAVTRKGSFMIGKDFFLKHGFDVVDTAASDFELAAKRFDNQIPWPKFNGAWEERQKKYGDELTIIRADQCPYTVKNVNEIHESAVAEFKIKPRIITLKDHKQAQTSPCPFGTFCILYEGKVIAEHPTSNTRFINIMKKILAKR